MNSKNPMTIILSLVLAFVIWAVSTSTTFATQITQVPGESGNSNSSNDSYQLLQSAQYLSAIANTQLTNVTDTYLLIGDLYREGGDYKNAEEIYKTSIELAEASKDIDTSLLGNAKLVQTRFLSGEIDEAQKTALVKKLISNYKASGGTLKPSEQSLFSAGTCGECRVNNFPGRWNNPANPNKGCSLVRCNGG